MANLDHDAIYKAYPYVVSIDDDFGQNQSVLYVADGLSSEASRGRGPCRQAVSGGLT